MTRGIRARCVDHDMYIRWTVATVLNSERKVCNGLCEASVNTETEAIIYARTYLGS